jgi:hypothetical protein
MYGSDYFWRIAVMPTVALKAHFDGQHILLDEAYPLAQGTSLVVVVLADTDAERENWARLSLSGVAGAYGTDEPEYDIAEPSVRR